MPGSDLQPITLELVGQVNKAWDEFRALGTETSGKLVEYVNKGREVGVYLDALKAKERDWEQLLLRGMEDAESAKPNKVRFTAQHAKSFARLSYRLKQPAKAPLDAISSLRDVMMLDGTLSFPIGHGYQKFRENDPVSTIVKWVMQIQAEFSKSIRDDLVNWDQSRKQHLRDQLQPIHMIWELLA